MLRRPVGPCLMITPWNFPLAVPARGVAAALAAGCTAVLRPSSLTPLCALALASTLEACRPPPGVLNVVVSLRRTARPTRCSPTTACGASRSPDRRRSAAT